MNRIAVIGISGSGKSTFSRKLAEKTGLPLYYMDKLFWKGKWEAVPEQQYLKNHQLLIQEEKWIIEGYVDVKMAERLSMADMIIYLDYSGLRCASHLFARWLKHRKESRPELPEGALEKFESNFFWLVFTRGERPVIEDAIQKANPSKLKRFYSPKELHLFLDQNFN